MVANKGPERETGKRQVSPELQKYIRFQEVGWALVCSWPVAMMLATMYGLDYIIPQMSALMLIIAAVVFFVGLVGRQELKEREDKSTE